MQPNAGRKKITSLLFVDPRRPRSVPDVPCPLWDGTGNSSVLFEIFNNFGTILLH